MLNNLLACTIPTTCDKWSAYNKWMVCVCVCACMRVCCMHVCCMHVCIRVSTNLCQDTFYFELNILRENKPSLVCSILGWVKMWVIRCFFFLFPAPLILLKKIFLQTMLLKKCFVWTICVYKLVSVCCSL